MYIPTDITYFFYENELYFSVITTTTKSKYYQFVLSSNEISMQTKFQKKTYLYFIEHPLRLSFSVYIHIFLRCNNREKKIYIQRKYNISSRFRFISSVYHILKQSITIFLFNLVDVFRYKVYIVKMICSRRFYIINSDNNNYNVENIVVIYQIFPYIHRRINVIHIRTKRLYKLKTSICQFLMWIFFFAFYIIPLYERLFYKDTLLVY